LIAAARVNHKTNVPIYVHTEGVRETVMATLELLKENGANLEKVNICHVNDRDYWKEVMDTGAYAGMDCYGSIFNMDSRMFFWETDLQRIKDLKRAIDGGYTHKITLGNDICMKMRLHKYGGWGYDHILTNLVPYMKREGITEEHLHTLFVENPKNFLDIAK
jgi:phosphotriesterase-related protein